MRFNIKTLEEKGFIVKVMKDEVEILPPPMSQEAWLKLKAVVTNQAGIVDPGLQDYAIGAFVTALHRAQILELAE